MRQRPEGHARYCDCWRCWEASLEKRHPLLFFVGSWLLFLGILAGAAVLVAAVVAGLVWLVAG